VHLLPSYYLAFLWECYTGNIYQCVQDPYCSPVAASIDQLKDLAHAVLVISGKSDVMHGEATYYVERLQLANVKVKHLEWRGTHVGATLFNAKLAGPEIVEELKKLGAL
jgi:acetyl esterase/lipase